MKRNPEAEVKATPKGVKIGTKLHMLPSLVAARTLIVSLPKGLARAVRKVLHNTGRGEMAAVRRAA